MKLPSELALPKSEKKIFSIQSPIWPFFFFKKNKSNKSRGSSVLFCCCCFQQNINLSILFFPQFFPHFMEDLLLVKVFKPILEVLWIIYFPWCPDTQLLHSLELTMADKRRRFLGKRESQMLTCFVQQTYILTIASINDYTLNFLSEILTKLQFFYTDLLFWSRNIKEDDVEWKDLYCVCMI